MQETISNSAASLLITDESPVPLPPPTISRSPQSLSMSIYKTTIANQSRLVTITWCKNLLLHGLSVSVDGPLDHHHYHCKVELKPWSFWRKQGSKHFIVDHTPVNVVWDLKSAKFNGEVEPQFDYYVAIVSEMKVVLVLGDLKKNVFRRTGCPPALDDPVLVSKREHLFGKSRFATRVRFQEKDRKCHDISVEWCNNEGFDGVECSPGMEIRIDGELMVHVKRVQWKFRGNVSIEVEDKTKVEICWDVHDWVFGSGPRHALFLFKPMVNIIPSSSVSSSPLSSFLSLEECDHESLSSSCGVSTAASVGTYGFDCLPEFCLFLYAWKLE